MTERVTDPAYLDEQYGDSERLRIRIEAHERYSERLDDWAALLVSHLRPAPGSVLLDVGCGPGGYHPALVQAGARIVALDRSGGMAWEARQRARAAALPVAVLQADALILPLADASCHLALASHVLFHVPDVRRALEELRRVVRPGGRVMLTANAADHAARLYELHCRAARELGYTPTAGPADLPFTLDDLPLVRAVFPRAERHLLPNAFLFPTTEAALRYYATGRVDAIAERQPDGSHRRPLLERVGALIEAIVAAEGCFRVPKTTGFFLATV